MGTRSKVNANRANDPYDFIRARAAQLYEQGEYNQAQKLLLYIDRATVQKLQRERHNRKAAP